MGSSGNKDSLMARFHKYNAEIRSSRGLQTGLLFDRDEGCVGEV